MPTPLPSDVSQTEKTFFPVSSDIEEEYGQQNKTNNLAMKAKGKALRVDTAIAMEHAMKGQSSAEDTKDQKQGFLRQKSCQECKSRKKRKQINKKRLKRNCIIAGVVMLAVALIIITLLATNVIRTDNGNRPSVEGPANIPGTTTMIISALKEDSPTRAPPVKLPLKPGKNATGTAMNLDLRCIKEPGSRLFFQEQTQSSKGLSGITYSNGFFKIETTGYYQLHLVVAIDGTKVEDSKKNDDVCLFYSIVFDDKNSISKKRQEQPGWKGTVEILENRKLLRKGQIVSVTVEPKKLVYDSVYDTRFQMIMTSPAKR